MAKLIIIIAAAVAFWFFASDSFENTFGDDRPRAEESVRDL